MTVRRFILVALFGALLALGGLWLARSVSAQELILTVSIPRIAVGEEMSVDIEARDMRATGLGAWTLDIMYDPDLLNATFCATGVGFSVCNPDFADGTVRLNGASTEAFPEEGALSLATILFKCLAPGEAQLTVVPRILVDQTLAEPQPIGATVQSGSFTCELAAAATPTSIAPTSIAATPTAFPHTGAGGQPGSDDLLHALVALMSGAGIAAMITFALLLLRARRL